MEIATIVSMTITVAAVVARFLPPPTPSGSKVYAAIYAVVNVVAQNGGQAANANAPVKQ
jgi:hypothetical protein